MYWYADEQVHAANPPETWQVRKWATKWALTTADNQLIGYFRTKRDALAEQAQGGGAFTTYHNAAASFLARKAQKEAEATVERLSNVSEEFFSLMAEVNDREREDYVNTVFATYGHLLEAAPVFEVAGARMAVSTTDIGGLTVELDACGNAVSATFGRRTHVSLAE